MSFKMFTIITVCRNAESTIEDTLKSVSFEKNTEHLEYCVVDGMSTDGTRDVIDQYRSIVDHLIVEKDANMYEAINKGIAASSGEVIAVLNADDYYKPGALSRIRMAYEESHKVDIVHAGMERVDASGDIVSYQAPPAKARLARRMPFHHPAMFVKREVYQVLGLYDTRFNSAADYDFAIRVCKSHFSTYALNDPITCFRVGGQSEAHWLPPVKQLIAIFSKNRIPWHESMFLIMRRVMARYVHYCVLRKKT